MGFVPYNCPILYKPDALNGRHVSAYSEGSSPSDSELKRSSHRMTRTQAPGPWPPSLLFQQHPTESATLTSLCPVGMVTLPSPRPVTLARPNTLPGVFLRESVRWVWVSGGTHLAFIQTGWHSAITQTPTDILHVFSTSLTVGFFKNKSSQASYFISLR